MFKKKIAFKLTAGFVIIVLISMLTLGILFIQMFRQYAFESRKKVMLERAYTVSQVMAEYQQGGGPMRGFGAFIHYLDALSEAKVWITDKNGSLSIMSPMGMGPGHMNNSDPLPKEAENVINEVLSGKESISESFSSIYNEATLTVGVPILDSSKQVIGTVFLHAPVTGVTETLDRAVYILSISLIAALLLAVCLGIFYSMLFTRPLKAMNLTALEMTRGNYSALTGVNRKDELGQLGNSLDLLASKLGYTIDQLFQEKGKMSDIITSISEGIIAFDTSLKPTSVNTALSEIMRHGPPYSNEDIEADLLKLGIHDLITNAIVKKDTFYITKEWLDKKLRFTLSPIVSSNGEVTGVVALVQDISESERLEQLRRDFVANVSHEFRTPLTVIRGSLEALVDGAVDQHEDVERYYQRMLSETRGLERLVGDLLDLSRLQSGKIKLNKESIFIPELLSDTVKSLQTIADKKDIKIECFAVQGIPPVPGDYDRLRQLFIIFLDNAVKYSSKNTTVTVTVRKEDMLTITIKDEGYGIPKEDLPWIWDRFYKADKSRAGSGTGLGLPIAKHLVELHQGKVNVRSELNKGTEIEVRLPYMEMS